MIKPALLALLSLLVAVPALAAETRPVLDEAAAATLEAWLDGVGGHLIGASRGDDDAQRELLNRAVRRGALAGELGVFRETVKAVGKKAEVRFSGLNLEATLWYGLVPVARADVSFWMTRGRLRILRLEARPVEPVAFTDEPGPVWTGDVAKALGALVEGAMKAATTGRCDELPTVSKADVAAAMPKGKPVTEGTMVVLKRFGDAARQTCTGWSPMPYHRVTWRQAELQGAIRAGREPAHPFTLALGAGTDGLLRLGTLTPPTD